jgi:hypothetical protein
LQKQEEEAAKAAAKAKKTRFSSMLKRQKANIGRMATMTKERQQAKAEADKAVADLAKLKKEKEGSERRSRFTSMFSRAAAKSKTRDLKSETERLKKRWKERPDLRKMIKSHDKMAACFRGYKLRKNFSNIKDEQLKMKAERGKAMVMVQKIVRGRLGRKKFLELQRLAWYDRPKTDATTNTIG